LTIAQLEQGQQATIKGFLGDELPIKLLEMGCLPGSQVQLVQVAPLKDPMHINVDGTQMAIRRATAAEIEIENILPL
jgi:ferrous iron transport protein A